MVVYLAYALDEVRALSYVAAQLLKLAIVALAESRDSDDQSSPASLH